MRVIVNGVRLYFDVEDIGKVGCPLLILAGEDDPASPASATRRVTSSARHPALDLHVFAGVGHGVFRQAATRAFGLLRDFLPERRST